MPQRIENLLPRQHAQVSEIPANLWDECAGNLNPFTSHAFLSALEASGTTGAHTGWVPNHISFSNLAGDIEAVVPMYVKSHSYGEYVFDQEWAAAYEKAGGAYYPKLQICVPFSPVTGPRFLVHPQSGLSRVFIGDALKDLMLKRNMSSLHATFCSEREWTELGSDGWLQRVGIQFHWHNKGYSTFDDFLGALTSSHRKSIRRERREANNAGLRFETLRGDDIKTTHWDAFYQFYLATVDRKWGAAYLTRDFFAQLSGRLGEKIVLMMAFHDAVPIAGALNLLGKNTLYGRNWGCQGEWPFLHFELCYYRAIDFAIEHGLTKVEAGAQGPHKLQRGYVPELTYSTHYIAHRGLSEAVKKFLDAERVSINASVDSLSAHSPFRRT
jgi:predicted N-acyltransferase